MVKFQLLSKSYIDGVLYPAGAIIERPPNWQGPKKSRQTIGGRDDWGSFPEEAPMFERVPRAASLPVLPVVASSTESLPRRSRVPPSPDLVRQAALNAEGTRTSMRANLSRSKFSGIR
jgi:hypothetical protein